MLILIAESKTMRACDDKQSPDPLRLPLSESMAADIMLALRGMDARELAEKVRISGDMAARLKQMIYDFPNKQLGRQAISAFTGVVFKALAYQSLDEESKRRCSSRVRLVSSLYGWLRPDDIIKDYRFDFTTALAPGGKTFAAFWRDSVTGRILEYLGRNDCREVLNLLPADGARCIDWKAVSAKARVLKADFRQIDGASVRTPHAGRLKTLRGMLLRQILTHDVNDFATLSKLQSADYMADGCSGDNITFVTA